MFVPQSIRLFTAAMLFAVAAPAPADAADRLVFGLDWVAEAEQGGFFQAQATGIYERYGLEVEIRPGGPQINNKILLAAGKLDLAMLANSLEPVAAVAEGVPLVAVAAFMQKDPIALMAHEGAGIDGLDDLAGHPLFLSDNARISFWRWLQKSYGLEEEMVRPYTYNLQPWLADPQAVVQAYATNEPFLAREAGARPRVLLLADQGWPTYAAVVTARRETVEKRGAVIQRFIDASIEGWQDFLEGDPEPAFAAIAAMNPDMPRAIMEFGRQAMIERGIVDSGDAQKLGLGAMTEERWQALARVLLETGIYASDPGVERAYTLEFVNRGAGASAGP
ncbi:ABC transporter substrate-binding protein [Geminicoccaceae bacterium 1502E]|nr:ABC transporter substrate-binding protein [Geminicoccaceae bacterium 1502E]